jgi:sugar phosphate isomerase/epimerase
VTAPRLSLCWLTVEGAHPLAHIDAAVAGGFDAVGLRLVPPAPTDDLFPVAGSEPLIREVLAKLADTGITVLDVETVWIGPDFDVERLRPALETGQRLGAGDLLTMGNDGDGSRLIDSFARLCEEAAKHRLRVGMEFAAFTKVPSVHAARRLVEAAGQPNGRVLIDTLHVARSGGTPSDLAGLDPGSLEYCQIADARGPTPVGADALRAEARGDRYLPGEGELPLGKLLDALPAGLPIGVEAPCAEHAAKSVIERGRLAGAALHRFLDRYQRREAS